MRYAKNDAIPKIVKWWLAAGLVLIFFQVIIGGVTRLTGSGLSITRWEIVVGTLPPIGETAWNEAFDLYKKTPQYQKINAGMPLADFKFIYFWEWFHRLWARSMGFIFLFPFLFFWQKGWLSRRLFRRLLAVVGCAALAAGFGWFMVWTGLRDRPWVNAYALTGHLGIAILTFSALLWATFEAFWPENLQNSNLQNSNLQPFSIWLTVICAVQIALGGVMSGMKAGLFYPTWPTMGGEWLPSVLLDSENWNLANVVAYDSHPFAGALVQFLHRNTAYFLAFLSALFLAKSLKINELRGANFLLLSLLAAQVLLGVLTLISCKGTVPVALGSMHQGCGILLFSAFLWMNFRLKKQD